jgi:hypothetical protein
MFTNIVDLFLYNPVDSKFEFVGNAAFIKAAGLQAYDDATGFLCPVPGPI